MNKIRFTFSLLSVGILGLNKLPAQGIDIGQGQVRMITVQRVSPKIAKIVFANPPVNLVEPLAVAELHRAISELSSDKEVKVVIFASSLPDYFINHFDLSEVSGFSKPSNDSISLWTDMVIKLSKAPFISIASIRGRTRGGGNELALAMDLRYASREKAIFGQPEVGTGIVPGGGGSERLPRLIGRDKALEVILSSSDYDAITAEKLGWVTKALPDAELDDYVNKLAKRVALFDKEAIVAAKAQINRASLPPDSDLVAAYDEFAKSMASPGFKKALSKLMKNSSQIGLPEMEKNLGYYIGLGSEQK